MVFLHGWGDSHTTFSRLVRNFDAEYECIRVDLPGFGGSQPPDSVWGLDEYASFVARFLDALKVTPYVLIGHSNGGAVVIKATANGVLHPKYIILLAAAGIRNKQKLRRFTVQIIAKTGKVATRPLPERYRRSLRKKIYGSVGSDMLVEPHLQETFKKTVRQDVQADAAKILIPTLLLYGSDDTATPPMYGEIYASLLAQSKLVFIPHAGHFLHHDAEDMVVSQMLSFLKGAA
jgi:pimeloyl-ACP methyl ester carboxylesterase